MIDKRAMGNPDYIDQALEANGIPETKPDVTREILRLKSLKKRGQESDDELLKLCRLLFDVGLVSESEDLLRHNMIDIDEGQQLYDELFGTELQEEFDLAIEAFCRQFNVELTFITDEEFLISIYHCEGAPPESDCPQAFLNSFEITFECLEPGTFEAFTLETASRKEGANLLTLRFENNIWKIVG